MKITITKYYETIPFRHGSACSTTTRKYTNEVVRFEGVTNLVDGYPYLKGVDIGEIEFNIIEEEE